MSVIDTSARQVIATLPVGGRPISMALDPYVERLYVASFEEATISVIDTESLVTLGAVGLISAPWQMALDLPRDRLYVARGDGVSVVSLSVVLDNQAITAGRFDIQTFVEKALPLPDFSFGMDYDQRRGLLHIVQKPARYFCLHAASDCPPPEQPFMHAVSVDANTLEIVRDVEVIRGGTLTSGSFTIDTTLAVVAVPVLNGLSEAVLALLLIGSGTAVLRRRRRALESGYHADVGVFDPATIADLAGRVVRGPGWTS